MFWQGFPMIFPKNAILKKIAFSLEKTNKIKGSSYEASMKKSSKSTQIYHRKNNIEKNIEKFGLGHSMPPFWKVWGGSWAPLGRSWAPCWRFLGALGHFLGASLVSWVLQA